MKKVDPVKSSGKTICKLLGTLGSGSTKSPAGTDDPEEREIDGTVAERSSTLELGKCPVYQAAS